jgi:hypothetical protein
MWRREVIEDGAAFGLGLDDDPRDEGGLEVDEVEEEGSDEAGGALSVSGSGESKSNWISYSREVQDGITEELQMRYGQ